MKTRIKKPLTALMMAWGTYLAIPCPYKVWDDALRPWQIVCLPPVGLIVGGLWALCAAHPLRYLQIRRDGQRGRSRLI